MGSSVVTMACRDVDVFVIDRQNHLALERTGRRWATVHAGGIA